MFKHILISVIGEKHVSQNYCLLFLSQLALTAHVHMIKKIARTSDILKILCSALNIVLL